MSQVVEEFKAKYETAKRHNMDEFPMDIYSCSELLEEFEVMQRQIKAMKTVAKSVHALAKKEPVEAPLYVITPSFQQMVALAALKVIEEPGVLEEIERKIDVHNAWESNDENDN
jgi:hypothetical protein